MGLINIFNNIRRDILVSIQGKNVIGIRRVAIERILKQYKVDQEIEIVVCRLKDPSFLLDLAKQRQEQQQLQKLQEQQQQNQKSASETHLLTSTYSTCTNTTTTTPFTPITTTQSKPTPDTVV